jgi:hypothetical protein
MQSLLVSGAGLHAIFIEVDVLGSEGEVCLFSNKAETEESLGWNQRSSTGAALTPEERAPARSADERRPVNMADMSKTKGGVIGGLWSIDWGRARCSVFE